MKIVNRIYRVFMALGLIAWGYDFVQFAFFNRQPDKFTIGLALFLATLFFLTELVEGFKLPQGGKK